MSQQDQYSAPSPSPDEDHELSSFESPTAGEFDGPELSGTDDAPRGRSDDAEDESDDDQEEDDDHADEPVRAALFSESNESEFDAARDLAADLALGDGENEDESEDGEEDDDEEEDEDDTEDTEDTESTEDTEEGEDRHDGELELARDSFEDEGGAVSDDSDDADDLDHAEAADATERASIEDADGADSESGAESGAEVSEGDGEAAAGAPSTGRGRGRDGARGGRWGRDRDRGRDGDRPSRPLREAGGEHAVLESDGKAPADRSSIMVVNDSSGEECRIAILQKGRLDAIFAERGTTVTQVGNIYKGRVTNVEPAIQAAFVDFGEEQSGFLHISDLHPRYFPGGERTERVGKKIPRRDRPMMQEALRRGDEVLVQVLKQGIGTKGPTLTSYLSIPGRLLVMMPWMDKSGVSRKVEDEDQRRAMKKILDSLDLPEGFGFILRTAGFDRTKTELQRDASYLHRLWTVMEKRMKAVGAPCELYTESDLLIRTIRDVVDASIGAIVVDSESAFRRAKTFLEVVAPRSAPDVVYYDRQIPIFHAFDVERQIELTHARIVPLRSGGALVIDQTEALVAIDVNSGRSRSARDSETNAFNTNCEAVDEIARQLRLRDLGGVIINDLIDMRSMKNRREVEDRFWSALRRDKAKTTIAPISEFGILEMTRQRMRPSLRKTHYIDCPHCAGHGEVKMPDAVAGDALRRIAYLLHYDRVARVEMACAPRVASVLLSTRRRVIDDLEDRSGKRIDIRISEALAVDRIDLYAYDDRGADIDVERLPAVAPPKINELSRSGPAGHAPVAAPVEMEEGGDGRRRRRRRKPGPADASAILLAGGFDSHEPEAADEPSLAEVIRRREVADAAAQKLAAQQAATQKTQAPAADVSASDTAIDPSVKPLRVWQFAQTLGVTAGDIINRCRRDGHRTIENRESMMSPELMGLVRVWFAAGRPAAQPSTGDDGGGRRRRRRGRGGRGGRGDMPEMLDGQGMMDGQGRDQSPPAPAVLASGMAPVVAGTIAPAPMAPFGSAPGSITPISTTVGGEEWESADQEQERDLSPRMAAPAVLDDRPRRIHELAKELGVTSKELLARCATESIAAKSHSSSIPPEVCATIRAWYAPPVGDDQGDDAGSDGEFVTTRAAGPSTMKPDFSGKPQKLQQGTAPNSGVPVSIGMERSTMSRSGGVAAPNSGVPVSIGTEGGRGFEAEPSGQDGGDENGGPDQGGSGGEERGRRRRRRGRGKRGGGQGGGPSGGQNGGQSAGQFGEHGAGNGQRSGERRPDERRDNRRDERGPEGRGEGRRDGRGGNRNRNDQERGRDGNRPGHGDRPQSAGGSSSQSAPQQPAAPKSVAPPTPEPKVPAIRPLYGLGRSRKISPAARKSQARDS